MDLCVRNAMARDGERDTAAAGQYLQVIVAVGSGVAKHDRVVYV